MQVASGSELMNAISALEEIGIREGMRVADLGCGATGHFVFPTARMVGPHGVVYAVDIQKNVLDGLRGRMDSSKVSNIELIWGDIERLRGVGVEGGSLDVAFAVNNLFLARDRVGLAREALRLLKSGGLFVVIDWKPTRSPFGPPPESRVAPREAQQMFEQVGFRFVRTLVPGAYHYGLIFEKL